VSNERGVVRYITTTTRAKRDGPWPRRLVSYSAESGHQKVPENHELNGGMTWDSCCLILHNNCSDRSPIICWRVLYFTGPSLFVRIWAINVEAIGFVDRDM
jgi:hypothetical protein